MAWNESVGQLMDQSKQWIYQRTNESVRSQQTNEVSTNQHASLPTSQHQQTKGP